MTVEHGTRSMYGDHFCRCGPCNQANNDYHRRMRYARQERPIPADVPHGRRTTYINWGCRCTDCTAVANAYMRAYRARRKQETTR